MSALPPRALQDEVAKHFQGTPAERIDTCLRLGDEVLDLYLATQSPGLDRTAARRALQGNSHRGRRPTAPLGRG
jgi:hypothetical protein